MSSDIQLLARTVEELGKRVTQIETTLRLSDENFRKVVDYVDTKKKSEEEWHNFVKDLRLRVASGGVVTVLTVIFLLIGWGIQHWVRGLVQ